jgi:hypothetical protein
MDEPTQDAVMQRLERLERESRRWKALGMTAVALLGPIVRLEDLIFDLRHRRFPLTFKVGPDTRKDIEIDGMAGGTLLHFDAGPYSGGVNRSEETPDS